MRRGKAFQALGCILAAAGALACGHYENAPAAPKETEVTSARRAHLAQTAPVEQAQAVPGQTEGAPVSPHGLVMPPAAGTGSGSASLVWVKPESWVEEAPSSGMRRAQYRVPGAGGDAECIVYYFGPGQGGGAEANAQRWAEQFKQPDGRSWTEVTKMTEIRPNGVATLLVEVTGTYSGGMGPGGMTGGAEKPNQMLLGAIAAGPDANWFFKLTGPEATVRAQQPSFLALVNSLKVGS